jgi:hypothetical protein
MEKEFIAGIEELIEEAKRNEIDEIEFLEDLESHIVKATSEIEEDFIAGLKEIIEEIKMEIDDPFNIFEIIQKLEIYIAKSTSIMSYEKHMLSQHYGNYFRIFPKDGTGYIDFIFMNQVMLDDRFFVIFKNLYDKGLTNYFSKIYIQDNPKGRGSILKTIVKNIYTIEKIQNEFNKHFRRQRIFDYNMQRLLRFEFTNE